MSWLLAFAAFAALVILHELGHFWAAKSVGMQATRFSLFFPPAIFKYKPKKSETTYEIGAIPLGGFVKITGMNPEEEVPEKDRPRAYFAMPVWKRVTVIAAGPAMNLLIAFLLIFVLFAFIGTAVGESTTNVKVVDKDAPASGKLEPGDKIISVNGKTGGAEQLVTALRASKCPGETTDGCAAAKPAVIVAERDGKKFAFTTTPRYDADTERMRIGISFDTKITGTETESIPDAFTHTVSAMWEVTKITFSLPARIFNDEQRKQISSAAGAYERTNNAIKTNTETTIKVIALISLSLALINLFPFLPLDGGHIFWALAEKIRGGKPVPVAVLERASIIGIAMIGMLFVIGLTNDIDRFINGWGPQ